MRQVLWSEICIERPNKAALGAFNSALAGGSSLSESKQAASEAATAEPEQQKTPSSKTSGYGVQKDGSFVASNLKQFGTKVDAMSTQKNPPSVKLKGRDGDLRKRVEKSGDSYRVIQYSNGKESRRDTYSKKEFEQNYRWYI